jgi:hypothetical protein
VVSASFPFRSISLVASMSSGIVLGDWVAGRLNERIQGNKSAATNRPEKLAALATVTTMSVDRPIVQLAALLLSTVLVVILTRKHRRY